MAAVLFFFGGAGLFAPLILHFVRPTFASGPSTNQVLNYQARLTDAAGIPLPDGAKNVKFVVFDAASGGNCEYSARGVCGTPTAKSVTLANSQFSTLIGEAGDVALPSGLFSGDEPRYLEIQVETSTPTVYETLAPRKRIVSTGFSMNANLLDDLDTSAIGGSAAFVPVTDISGNLTLTNNLAAATIGIGGTNVITAGRALQNLTGVSSSGTITFSGLTASRALFTDGSSNLAASGASSALLNALTDETGTGVAVFATSPALATPTVATSLATGSTSFDLVNTMATTVNFAGAATTLNLGAATGTATINNATVNLANGGLSTAGTSRLTNAGALQNITGIASSGTITFSGLTASRALFTDGSSNLATSGASAALLNALTDETGSGVAVFGTSPTIATPTITTSATVPLVIGGTGTGSTLSLRSTSGVGTTDAIIFQVGNNGGTEAMRVINSGNVGIGTASPNSVFEVEGGASNAGPWVTLRGGGTVSENVALRLYDNGTADANTNVLEFAHSNAFVQTPVARIKSSNVGSNAASGAKLWLETASDNAGTWNTDQLVLRNNGTVGIGDATPSNKLDVAGAIGISDTTVISSGRAAQNLTGVSSSGTITFSGLTASRTLFTDGSSNLTASGASSALLNALTDETGTGVAVFGTSPSFTTSITTGSTSFDLINTTATTLNIGGAATTLNLAGGSGSTGCTVDGSGNLTCSGTVTSGSSQAFVQNGNSFGAAAVLGTNDSNTLSFETNNSTRMTIDTSGNIGVGTSSPGVKLDVVGDYMRLSGTNDADLYLNAASTGSFDPEVQFQVDGVSKGYVREDFHNGYLAISGSNNTTQMIFKSGNVGIGTSTPPELLTLHNANNGSLLVDNGYVITPYGGLGRYHNYLRYSEQFDNAVWTTANSTTVTANSGSVSDPTSNVGATADILNAGTAGTGEISQPATGSPATASTTWTGSVWMKVGSGTATVNLRIDSGNETGTASAKSLTTQWQRFSVTQSFTPSSTGTATFRIINGNVVTHVWGAELTSNSNQAGVYVRTEETAVTTAIRGFVTNYGSSVFPNGSVGVGITVPSAKLHVADKTNSNATVETLRLHRFREDSTAPGAADFGADLTYVLEGFTDASQVTGVRIRGAWEAAQANDTTSRDSYLSFATMLDNSLGERLRIDSNGRIGIGDTTPTNLLDVAGAIGISDTTVISAGRALQNITGISSSGTITYSGLTASRALFTDGSSNLAASGASSALLNALTDETGTGVAVFGTSPTFTTDITTPIVIGGTGTGSSLRLRSTSGVGATDAILFQVGNNGATEAMRIKNSGEVGIGVAGPAYKLHVAGGSGFFDTNVGADPFIIARQYLTSDQQEIRIGVADNVATTHYINDEDSSRLEFRIQNTDTESGGGAAANDNSVLNITGNKYGGYVGIKTTGPLRTLEVVGSARTTGKATAVLTGSIDPTASTSVTGVGTLFTTELVVGDRITVTGETRTVSSIASNTSLTVDTAFSDNANDTSVDVLYALSIARDSSSTPRLVINDIGNVGIGATAPGGPLDILRTQDAATLVGITNANSSGTSAFSGYTASEDFNTKFIQLMYRNAGGDNSDLIRIPASGVIRTGSGATGGLVLVSQASSAPMIFGTGGAATSNERLRITSAGNVGIGDTTPTNLLDVAGAIGISDTTIITAGRALQNITGYTQTSGNFSISGTGTFGTGTGAISLNGPTTLAANQSLTMASGTGAFNQTYTGTTTTARLVSSSTLTTAPLVTLTSTNNSAANTAWSANLITATNAQGTTAVSTGSIAGVDIQFVQGTAIAGNTETAARINLKQNDSSTTDATVSSLLDLANNDTATGNQATVTDAIKITGANVTNGINFSGTFGTNLITSTNFIVTQAGATTLGTSLTTPIVNGGSAVGSTLTLRSTSNGTPSGDAIIFVTNATERMRIMNNGNVGIGIGSGAYRLNLVATDTSSMYVESVNSTVALPGIDYQDTGRGTNTVISSFDGTTVGSYIAAYSNHPLMFAANASSTPTARMVLATSGNVGIGTTTPNLHGYANAGGLLTVQNIAATTLQGVLELANRTDADAQPIGDLAFSASSQTGAVSIRTALIRAALSGATANNRGSALQFYTRANGGTNDVAERVRIESTGNVGIGDTTPAALFTVGSGDLFQVSTTGAIAGADDFQIGATAAFDADVNTLTFDSRVKVLANNTTTTGITNIVNGANNSGPIAYFLKTRSASATADANTAVVAADTLGAIHFGGADGAAYRDSSIIRGAAEGTIGSGFVPGRLTLETSDSAGTMTERMRVDSAGDVGINTTGPATKLEIIHPNQTLTGNSTGDAEVAKVHFAALTNDTQAADVGAAIGLGGNYNTSPNRTLFGAIAGRKTNSSNSNNSGYLSFYSSLTGTGLVERMRIDDAGNVGIETTTPSEQLSIEGNVAIGNTDTSSYALQFRTRADEGITDSAYTLSMMAPENLIMHIDSNNNGTTNAFAVVNNQATAGSLTNELFRIQENGNVGIGTAAPNSLFEVAKALSSTSQYTSTQFVTITNTDTTANNWGTISFHDAAAGAASTAIQTKYTDHTNDYGELHFSTRGTGGMSSRLVIDTAGNVGVGTAAPGSPLTVRGAAGTSIVSIDDTATGGEITLGSDGTGQSHITMGGSGSINGEGSQFRIKGTSTTPLAFFTNGSQRMLIDSSGNVGVGTTPTTRFDVSGQDATFYSGAATQIVKLGRSSTENIELNVQDTTSSFVYNQDETDGTDHSFTFNIDSTNTGNRDWAFQSAGTQLVKFDKTGRVNIGTGSPTTNFNVAQSTTGPGTVATAGSTTLTGTNTQFTNTFKPGDTITVSGETVRTISTITSATVLTVTSAFSTTASGLSYTLTGGTRLSVLGNGQLALSTGDTNTVGILSSTNAGNSRQAIYFDHDGSATNNDLYLGSAFELRDSLSGAPTFYTAGSASVNPNIFQVGHNGFKFLTSTAATIGTNFTPTTAVVIENGGDVGIGDTTPDAKLDVEGASTTTFTALNLQNTDTTSGAEVVFNMPVFNGTTGLNVRQSTNSTGPAWASGSYDAIIRTGQTSSKLHFAAGASSNTPNLTINSNGSVGVGTVSASSLLHVVGSQPASVGTTPGTTATDAFTITGGAGGNTTIATTGTGGVGADITETAGTGGQATAATTASTGGAGGAMTYSSGAGGAAAVAGTGTNTGGIGGAILIAAGNGGAATGATTSTNTGGNGGTITLRPGTGGSASNGGTNTAGSAGSVLVDFPSADFQFTSTSTSGYVTTFDMDNTGLTIGHSSSVRTLELQTNSTTRLTIGATGGVTIADANTLTANGQLLLGDGGETAAINSSDWDIDATGIMTGIGAITSNGLFTTTAGATISGAAISLNASSNFAVNIGTGTTTSTVTIGGGSNAVAIAPTALNVTLTTTGDATFASSTANTDTISIKPQTTSASSTFDGQITSNDLTAARTWTFPDVTGTVITSGNAAFTATGTIDLNSNILTNIGNTGTDFIASTGALTVAGGQALAMSSGTGAFSQTFTGTTTTAHSITANSLTTGTALNVTSSNNSASATVWTANDILATNAQGTTAAGAAATPLAAFHAALTQVATVAGNTETVARLEIAANGSAATDAAVDSILNLANNDTATGNQITATNGILINGANVTTGINLSGTFGTNLITSTNFTVTQAGAITAVGVNSGAGLIQGTAGLTITGATNVNTSGSNATNIGTGTNAGTITIGNSSTGDLALNDTNWSISGAGAATFTGTLTASGLLQAQGSFTFGDNGDTGSVNTSDWDISTTGVMTGISGITSDGAIAANAGITFDNSTDTVGAHTMSGTLDLNANILTNIGNTGTDFIASTGALTLAGVLTANGGVTVATGGYDQTSSLSSGAAIANWNRPTFTSNDATPAAMGSLYVNPTLNYGASNSNKTIYVLNVDTTNTSLTGTTVVPVLVSFGGTNLFKIESNGTTTINRTSDGTVVNLQSGGATQGTISISGATTSYNAFTGSHYAWTDAQIDKGMLVTLTGDNKHLHDDPNSEILYGIALSAQKNNPKILGAYLAIQEPSQERSLDNPHLVMAVGNADIWVSDEGGNIEIGDFLIAGSTPGHAMKDDSSVPVSNVIARAAEPVDWSEVNASASDGKKHRMISVFFESFTRYAAAPANINVPSANYTLSADFNVNGHLLLNVRGVIGLNWSISEEGKLTAKEVEAEKVTTKEVVVRKTDAVKTIGQAVIPAGATSVTVNNSAVHAGTEIFVTFRKNPRGGYWVDSVGEGAFTVMTENPVPVDAAFSYWLVGVIDETTPVPTGAVGQQTQALAPSPEEPAPAPESDPEPAAEPEPPPEQPPTPPAE